MKERLTGAIILVVLIVLLVPELLSGPSRPAPAPVRQAAATSSEEPPLRSYTIDLADDSHPASSTASAEIPSPQASGPTQPPTIVERSPAAATQPSSSAAAPAETSASSPSNAQEVQAPGGAEGSQQPTRPPAATSSQKHTPERPATQPEPSPPRRNQPAPSQRADAATTGWMVQLGVFAKHENAERLVRELKEQGIHALVSESRGGGRTLWRVRTGPLTEHAAAEQLSARLRAAGHAASVVSK